MLHSVLTVTQEILFLAMFAYAHIIFYSTDTYYLPLNLSLCICIVMLVTWHADPKPFLKRFTCYSAGCYIMLHALLELVVRPHRTKLGLVPFGLHSAKGFQV